MGVNLPVGEYFGIELESSHMIRARMDARLAKHNFRIDRDASVETPVNIMRDSGSFYFIGRQGAIRSSSTTIGFELVSPPMDAGDRGCVRGMLYDVTTYMESLGAHTPDPRAGIHVHVSSPHSLHFMKSILSLWARYEAVLYHLACADGTSFRGESNNAAYCRPLAKPPAVVGSNGVAVPCMNLEDCLEAKTAKEFWARYGDTVLENIPDKHRAPCRYLGMTVWPIAVKGTTEFRIFNLTLQPALVQAYIYLAVNMVKVALGGFEYRGSTSPFTARKENLQGDLEELLSITSLDPEDQRELRLAFRRAKQVQIPPDQVYSHLVPKGLVGTFYTHGYSPKPIGERVINPAIEDVHVLNGRQGRE